MARILVTCVGSGVGQSVVDSLNMLREDYIIGCDMNRNTYATHFCDEFHCIPSLHSDGYLDFILSLAKDRKADLIIPGHDHELSMFSKNISRFRSEGIEVLVSEPEVIEISRDKYLWHQFFKGLGCNIVPTYKVDEFKANPDLTIFPAIIKPAGGSASQGISIVHDIHEISDAHDDDIIQPYLFPTQEDQNYGAIVKAVTNRKFVQMSEISIQLIFGKDAKFKAIFISRNTLKNGVPVFIDPIQPKDFEYLHEIMKFVPICEERGVMGPVNIQGRITKNGLCFFEMNMRFTGITGNRAQLGFNEVKYLSDIFLDRKRHSIGTYCQNKLGVRQVACTTIPREKNALSSLSYTILGAGGFIGSNYMHSLLGKEHERINLICRDSSFEKYSSLFEGKTVYVYRASDPLIESIYCQTDVLINFTGALATQNDVEKFDSVLFQYEQVQKIIKANIPLVINISSQSVYSQVANIRKTEADPVSIESAYAFQKHIGEKLFGSIKDFYPHARCVSLRFPRIVGRGDLKVNGFFQRVVEALERGEEVKIPYPNNNTCLLDVQDAISAIDFIVENDIDLPNVVNVAGININMREYVETAIQVLGNNNKEKLIQYGSTSDVISSSQIDDSLFRSFGWKNRFSLPDIIRHIKESLIVKAE